jgi:hypothetical protein
MADRELLGRAPGQHAVDVVVVLLELADEGRAAGVLQLRGGYLTGEL